MSGAHNSWEASKERYRFLHQELKNGYPWQLWISLPGIMKNPTLPFSVYSAGSWCFVDIRVRWYLRVVFILITEWWYIFDNKINGSLFEYIWLVWYWLWAINCYVYVYFSQEQWQASAIHYFDPYIIIRFALLLNTCCVLRVNNATGIKMVYMVHNLHVSHNILYTLWWHSLFSISLFYLSLRW